jgi:nicotinamidase-related amidase
MTTALVLIDIQNDYFPGGAMALAGPDAAAAQAARLLAHFRAAKRPVFHVQHIAEQPEATFFRPGTGGAEIHAAVQPLRGEPVVVKHHPNSFRETTLLADLRAAGATRVVFAGMMTHMCVDTTVRAAADLGFDCTLAGDACATTSLAYAGQTVEAGAVQLAYLAALNDGFAKVVGTAEACGDLT